MSEGSWRADPDIRSLLGFSEYSRKSKPIDTAMKCRRLGLKAFQLVGDFPSNFPEKSSSSERAEVRDFITEHDLRLHFHAPTDIPLASRHNRLRLAAVDRMKDYIELARDMGASSFVFHPTRFAFLKLGSRQVVFEDGSVSRGYFQRFEDSSLRLADGANGALPLLLENTSPMTGPFLGLLERFLTHPSTGLAWDIGHTSADNSGNASEIADFFAARLDSIKLAHVHDVVDGRTHLALGSGRLNLPEYIEIFRQLRVPMIIEVFSDKDLMASLDYISSLTPTQPR